jgi:hypothetical protein
MSFTYNENKIGDKCPPRRTSEEILKMKDALTHWTLSDRI